jgi:hypothetical protein
MSQLLDINTWDHVCPVLLPVGASTMSTVFSASMGILVPFAIFVVAFFVYLHGLWVGNSLPEDYTKVGTRGKYGGSADAGDAAFLVSVSTGRETAFIDPSQKRNLFPGSRPGTARSSTRESDY